MTAAMRMTDGASGKRQEQRAVSSPMGELTSPFRNEFAIAMSDPITPRMNKMETKKNAEPVRVRRFTI